MGGTAAASTPERGRRPNQGSFVVLVPVWLLSLAAIVVVIAIGFLLLALRRALDEMLFWRGAYVHITEQAHVLLEQASEPILEPPESGSGSRPNGCTETGLHRASRNGRAAETNGRSPLAAYASVLDCVHREAKARKIDWATATDMQFFRARDR